MQIEILKSKIHRVAITEANLHYMGSITIDEDLMDAANLVACEKVTVANIDNGERFDTYVIKGERGSGKIGVNGAAAHKVKAGHLVIIMAYAAMTPEEAKTFHPAIVFPDSKTNKLIK
jgi:aspartate 1-decarboxylase